ncbi:glycerophosphodiester phosphodiesterase [Nocardioides mangrovicus]|nr:glycerophosphodiester phosphodiesterase family protein [Nocardioides mangrovicus]
MRPQVVAHRGLVDGGGEHTLTSYLAALDQGAEALECDVRLTADGHLVCVHDRDLRRTARSRHLVSTSELAALADLDVTMLTLRRLLETVAELPQRVELAIETKHPTRYAGLVEKRLVELLDQFDWLGPDSPVRVMSFSWLALKRIERMAPDLDVVLLFESPGEWLRSRAVASVDWIAGPDVQALRDHPKAMRRIAEVSRVHCWTVNTPDEVDRCLDLGVEALITDRPATVLTHLTRRERSRDVLDRG